MRVSAFRQLVDRSTEHYGSIFSPYGSAVDVALAALRGKAHAARSVVPFAALNVAQRDLPREMREAFGLAPLGPMNYLPAFLEVSPVHDVLMRLRRLYLGAGANLVLLRRLPGFQYRDLALLLNLLQLFKRHALQQVAQIEEVARIWARPKRLAGAIRDSVPGILPSRYEA